MITEFAFGNRVRKTGIERIKSDFLKGQEHLVRDRIDNFIDQKIESWYLEVPGSRMLEQKEINREYYKRHLIETAWRIRLLRVIESKAIAELAKISPLSAQSWARYEMEEMLHDEMFLDDLESMGMSKEEAVKIEPYLSTKLLVGFFSYLLDHEGPLGVLAYSYLVEYVNVKLDPKKLKSLEQSLGSNFTQGYATHTKTDEVEDHPGEVWESIRHLINSEKEIQKLMKYIDEHQKILSMYFTELYNEFGK